MLRQLLRYVIKGFAFVALFPSYMMLTAQMTLIMILMMTLFIN